MIDQSRTGARVDWRGRLSRWVSPPEQRLETCGQSSFGQTAFANGDQGFVQRKSVSIGRDAIVFEEHQCTGRRRPFVSVNVRLGLRNILALFSQFLEETRVQTENFLRREFDLFTAGKTHDARRCRRGVIHGDRRRTRVRDAFLILRGDGLVCHVKKSTWSGYHDVRPANSTNHGQPVFARPRASVDETLLPPRYFCSRPASGSSWQAFCFCSTRRVARPPLSFVNRLSRP